MSVNKGHVRGTETKLKVADDIAFMQRKAIIQQLKILNMHMEQITKAEFDITDLEGES